MFVYLGLFLHTIVTVLQMIVARTMCHTSDSYNSVNTLLELIGIVATIMALGSLLRFYDRFSKEYSKYNLFLTFSVYKGVVLLYMLETLIITIVEAQGAVETTAYMSQADFDWGVHSFMVCCQSCIFSFLYVTSLSGWIYRPKTPGPAYGPIGASGSRHGPEFTKGRLLLDVFFPREPFTGFAESMRTLFSLFRGRKRFDYTGKTGVTHEQRVAAHSVFARNHGVGQDTGYARPTDLDSHELLPKRSRGNDGDNVA